MKKLFCVVCVVFSIFCMTTLHAADEPAKNINSLIRTAEKEFFKGKLDQANDLLTQASTELEQLKATDSDNKALQSLQRKYDRLRKQVDKKMGVKAAASAPSTAQPAASSGGDTLSHGAKSTLAKALRSLDSADRELVEGEKKLASGDLNMASSHIFNLRSQLDGTQNLFDRAVNNNKANPEHPEFAPLIKRHQLLEEKYAALKEKAEAQKAGAAEAAATAQADAEALNNKWLPQIKTYVDAPETRIQYPGSYNTQLLEHQNTQFKKAQSLLADIEKNVQEAQYTHQLKQAVDKLRFAIEVYNNDQKADQRNRLQPIESELSLWSTRFAQNKKWDENSGASLFYITEKKLAYQRQQIESLRATAPDEADAFTQRLDALEKENSTWLAKRQKWESRPRPLPAAKMQNAKLEKEMTALLKNRGMKPKKLVITDKDWWVLKGEYRYMTTAVLSKDSDGEFWQTISFRQMATITGYGPTEVMQIEELKIRLP